MAQKQFGGIWTERKLDVFEEYVEAYLNMMNNNRDKLGWKLIYFDAFAGSGSRESEQKDKNKVPLFDIKAVYRGAAERIVNIDLRGFDYYYFIESDKISKMELEKILKPSSIEKNQNLRFRSGDANEHLIKHAKRMKSNNRYFSLILADPFGMQVNWKSIEQLKGTETDMWILIPSSVNRLLDRNGKLTHIDKLVSFFGLSGDEIKERFYRKKTHKGLLDIEDEVQKVSNPIQKIVEVYIEQLRKVFDYVTPKPLILRNSRKVPIYHFAFASKNPTALKIANEIIGGRKK